MKNFFNGFKIPTLLGLAVILSGIAAGVFLTLREQNILSEASPNTAAQNITLSNISDDSVTISWQTSNPTTSFITFGLIDANEQTVLDDRDSNPPAGGPKLHSIHYATIKNLLPKSTYQYKVISGKISSEVQRFTTAAPLTSQTGFRPIIGTILEADNPLDEGIAYLSIADASLQSALIKNLGNFLIPISQIRNSDLSGTFPLTEDTLAKLTVVSAKGEATALFKLADAYEQLPPIKLGENLDLTTNSNLPITPQELNKYDLNDDGKINATDNAIILQNFGRNPKNTRADLNQDKVVDQKDLDLMAKQINQLELRL